MLKVAIMWFARCCAWCLKPIAVEKGQSLSQVLADILALLCGETPRLSGVGLVGLGRPRHFVLLQRLVGTLKTPGLWICSLFKLWIASVVLHASFTKMLSWFHMPQCCSPKCFLCSVHQNVPWFHEHAPFTRMMLGSTCLIHFNDSLIQHASFSKMLSLFHVFHSLECSSGPSAWFTEMIPPLVSFTRMVSWFHLLHSAAECFKHRLPHSAEGFLGSHPSFSERPPWSHVLWCAFKTLNRKKP